MFHTELKGSNVGFANFIKTLFRGLPIITIIASALGVIGYHNNLYNSLQKVKTEVISIENAQGKVNAQKSYDYFGKIIQGTQGDLQSKFVLANTEVNSIPNSLVLTLSYLGIFLFAELSFILMSLKEYLQDILNLEDDCKNNGLNRLHSRTYRSDRHKNI